MVQLGALDAAQKMRLAMALCDTGLAMMRQRLHRERPSATAAEINAAIHAWLRERPGAVHGDCVGKLRELPEWAKR